MATCQVAVDSIEYYLKNNKHLKALYYANKKSDEFLKKKDYKTYCQLMHRKAILYEDLNDHENAFKTLYTYGKIAEKKHLVDETVQFYAKLGNLYTTNLNFSSAKKYLYKAKKYAFKSKSNRNIGDAHQALFRLHATMFGDSSKYYLEKTDYYFNLSNDIDRQIKAGINAYAYYDQIKDHQASRYYILKTMKLKDKAINPKSKNIIDLSYGYYLISQKRNKEAIALYKQLIKNIKEGEDIKNKSNAILNISYAYEMIGDYKNALKYSNIYLDLQDQINSGKIKAITNEIEAKYLIEKAEADFKTKNQTFLEKQKKNEKVFYLLASLIILTIGISYFFFQNLKLKQSNKLNSLQNDLQNNIISATIDGQEEERARISEVLHDSVSATLSSIGLHLSAFESSLNEEQRKDLQKTRSLLKQAHDKVRDLSHELIPPLLVKFGLDLALKDLCESNSNAILKFNFISSLPKNKKLHSDLETKIYYMISELCNNIIKHAHASEVIIKLSEEKSKLKITIQDNGIGFNEQDNSFGFGLTQIKARIRSMKGNFKISSQENEGTLIRILIPI